MITLHTANEDFKSMSTAEFDSEKYLRQYQQHETKIRQMIMNSNTLSHYDENVMHYLHESKRTSYVNRFVGSPELDGKQPIIDATGYDLIRAYTHFFLIMEQLPVFKF
jgi:hypothetical protein